MQNVCKNSIQLKMYAINISQISLYFHKNLEKLNFALLYNRYIKIIFETFYLNLYNCIDDLYDKYVMYLYIKILYIIYYLYQQQKYY